ncbi:MAG: thiol reductant ABC exporter subunit CydD [Paracoccus sp. (in: a-proteobacteria)]|uniref:thiol reductant ABC exporter subunit CydD n=1 Tax=Paracoccus sp. TaxID=267 RepID=UPI0039E52B5F
MRASFDWIPALAALLWLPQAALLAFSVGALAAGGADYGRIAWAGFGVLALGLSRAGLEAWAARASFGQARARLTELRGRAVALLAGRSPLDRARVPSGEAASILAEQAEALVPWLARYLPARRKASLVPVAIFLTVLAFSWVAAVVLLVAMPLIPMFMALIGWKAKDASEAQLVRLGQMNAVLLDRLRGMQTIRGLGAVEPVARQIRAEAEDLRRRSMTVLRIAFLSSAVLELFAALGVAMVAVYVGFHLLGQLPFGAWGGRLDLGQGLFILMLAPAFFEPMRELSAIWHDRAAGEAARDALERLQDRGMELPGAEEVGGAVPAHPPALRIEGLGHRHAGAETWAVRGLDLDLRPGQHLALTGPSGCGKSTVLALIAGLAPVQEGRILIDGLAMGPETAAGLRARIGWLGQAPHVFPGTLAQNVALGRDLAPGALRDALARVHLDHLSRVRGDAPLGEGGMGISGGEALRLVLARIAVSADAGLILADEPTAHLDPLTARAVTAALLEIARGRSLIVATHDPALAQAMDLRIDLNRREVAA